ncbi:VOC family protein [Acetobacteraceae bacterium H6797]|nr:VOC family protein [Acetobacteraceae bacterium H6797]
MSTATCLDHIGLCTAEPDKLWSTYERLGFTLTPPNRQSGKRRPDLPVEPFGTGNRCAMLKAGYIELLVLIDPALPDNGLQRFLDRYVGMHILALGMEEEEANLARLRRAGIEIPGVAWLERPVDGPGSALAKFARLPLPDAPEGRVQLIRHLTPELMWQTGWMTHANRAERLEEAILVSDAPAEAAARLSRLAGLPLTPDPLGGFRLTLPGPWATGPDGDGGCVRIIGPEALPALLPGVEAPALPFLAGFVLRTGDGNAAVRKILEGLPVVEVAGGLMVPPEAAGGAALVFKAG